MRILIVDDDTSTSSSIALVCRQRGHCPVVVEDGGAAMVEMGKQRPDIIILDLMLPRVNGWEMLDSKSACPLVTSIPVIVFTGYPDVQQPVPSNQNIRLLVKPVEPIKVVELAELFVSELVGG